MINVNNPYSNYQQVAIETASSEKLLIMLYDGAIKFMNAAKMAMNANNFEAVNINLIRAQDIISELMYTLNMDYPISNHLFALYDYFKNRLISANMKKDVEPLEEIIAYMVELRDTWKNALISTKDQRTVSLDDAAI